MPEPVRVVLATGVLLLAVACGDAEEAGGAEHDPTAAATVDGETLVAELCVASQNAGDPAESGAAFDRAHGALHDLARELAEIDRAAAARLHEAKQRAEASRTAGEPTELEPALAALTDAARDALASLGQQTGACPAGE